MKPMVCGTVQYNPMIAAIEGAGAKGLILFIAFDSYSHLNLYLIRICFFGKTNIKHVIKLRMKHSISTLKGICY